MSRQTLRGRKKLGTQKTDSTSKLRYLVPALCGLAIIAVTVYQGPLLPSYENTVVLGNGFGNIDSGLQASCNTNTASTSRRVQNGLGGLVPTHPQKGLRDDLIKARSTVEQVWADLIKEATIIHQREAGQGKPRLVAMEVGVHSAGQCVQAAEAGLDTHCVEPSPKSFQRIEDKVNGIKDMNVRQNIHLYNVAAGPTSGEYVDFSSSGGTGDHVGRQDMWAMTEERTTQFKGKEVEIVKVPTMRLDDIVIDKLSSNYKTDGDDIGVFAMKIDTQGYEPAVISGLSKSIQQHKIQFLLMEYWPRGMNLLANIKDDKKECIGATVLQTLIDAGYTIYATGVYAHPKAPKNWSQHTSTRPLDDIVTNCHWYLDIEGKIPASPGDEPYRMGYWSDVIAVAPTAPSLLIPKTSTTDSGTAFLSS